jgi:hypothetical protein
MTQLQPYLQAFAKVNKMSIRMRDKEKFRAHPVQR